MNSITESFEIVSRISNGSESEVYLIRLRMSGEKFLLKKLRANCEGNRIDQKIRFRRELDIVSSLDHPHIAKPEAVHTEDDEFSILYPLHKGRALSELMQDGLSIPAHETFHLIIQLLEALDYIHTRGVIHCDLSPNNIFVSDSRGIELLDFGFSLTPEEASRAPEGKVLGILPYLSPEQMGFTEFKVDTRSDLYCVGLLLYRLVSGKLPFLSEGESVSQLLDSSLKKEVEPIRDLPSAINMVILKSLRPSPEERYQTAAGFKSDLEYCIQAITNGDSGNFIAGERDAIIAVNRSKLFVARDKEIKVLANAYEKLLHSQESSILLWGKSGVGKTEIVNRFAAEIDLEKASFISAKCNRFSSHQPHSILRRIVLEFSAFAHNCTTEKRIGIIREIDSSLKEYSGVICSVIPEAKNIFLEIGAVSQIEPDKETERVSHALYNLMLALSRSIPMVIFIDDLQWIDKVSFNVVLKCIATKQRFLFVFGYRTENNDSLDVLGIAIKDIGIHRLIALQPFAEAEISRFLRSRFGFISQMQNLVSALSSRTDGYPFTLAEACRFLVNNSILKQGEAGWYYEQGALETLPRKFDSVSLVLSKMLELNEEQSRFLRYSALIEGTIELDIVQLFSTYNLKSCISICEVLELLGFIARRTSSTFVFTHDKIQESVSAFFSDEEKMLLFEQLGDVYVARTLNEERYVFDAAECYLKSANPEKAAIACNNAAQCAIRQIAFDVAKRYLKNAVILCSRFTLDGKNPPIDLLNARNTLGNVLMLSGDHHQALKIFMDIVESVDLSKRQRVEANFQIGTIYHNIGEFENAIQFFGLALGELGIKLPEKNGIAAIALIWEIVKLVTLGAGLKHCIPKKKNPYTLLSIRILNKLSYSLFFKNILLCCLADLKAINIADCVSDSYEKAEAYAFHMIVAFQSFLKNRAFSCLKQSLRIAEKINRRDMLAFAQSFGGITRYFAGHWAASSDLLSKSIENYEAIGDAWGQVTPLEHLAYIKFARGEFAAAEEIMLREERMSIKCADFRGRIAAHRLLDVLGELKNDHGPKWLESLQNEMVLQNGSLVKAGTALSVATIHWLRGDIYKTYGGLQAVSRIVKDNKLFNQEYIAQFPILYCEVICCELLSRKPNLGLSPFQLKREMKKYAVQAFIAGFAFPAYAGASMRITGWLLYFYGAKRLAKCFFKHAIKKHHSLDMRYEEAKSRRDYALFLEECNRPGEARDQFEHAYKLFEQCGAVLETNRLKDRVGILPQSKKESDSSDSDTRVLPVFGADKFRVDALFKVSASMTEIDDTDMLLKQIVRGMIEVTGAQYGCILLEQHDRAQKSLAMDFEGRIMSAGELGYSKAIVDKVRATREIVMTKRGTQELGEEMKEGETETVRSAMCVPLFRAEDYLGCVYLANNLVSGLFSEGSKKAAHILSAQAGILLENAYLMAESRRLNASLDHKVKEQTRDITEKNRQLEDANLKLIESERMKSILSGTLVHDIKNYAAGIEGNLQHLGRRLPDDPRISRIVGVVAESCVDIVSLASNLLDIAKMDEGKMVIRPEPIDIGLIQEMLAKFTKNSLFEEKEIVPQINLPDFPVAIKADVYLLQRVFQNILSNAAKYVPRGGEVVLSFERGTDEDVICFFNSGPAIPDQDKTILFEKYARLETACSQYSKGLGLFFCKMVMNAHGGRIWVDTNEHGNYFRMAFRKSDIQRVPLRAAS